MAHALDNLQTQRVSVGHSVDTLARKANVSDYKIVELERGATCLPHESQRIADALGVSLSTLGKRDL